MSLNESHGLPPKAASMRTPLGRVRALGASHSGTTDFWRQRLTAVAMTLLILPVVVPVTASTWVAVSKVDPGAP